MWRFRGRWGSLLLGTDGSAGRGGPSIRFASSAPVLTTVYGRIWTVPVTPPTVRDAVPVGVSDPASRTCAPAGTPQAFGPRGALVRVPSGRMTHNEGL